jgi:glycosyltransferase involved in cell wall biosynthesis
MLKFKYDISIVILNYNREKFLDRAIRSCATQLLSGKSQEVIIIDDCSTDKSIEFLKKYNEVYKNDIKIFYNKKNMGIGYCSKLAVNLSQGKYFMRVDSDDFLNRNAVDIMADILDFNQNYGFVYCDHYKTDEWGLKQKIVKLNKNNLLHHGAGVLFRRNLIKKVGNYNSKLKEAEDYDLISRLNKICKPYYLPLPLYRYYMHEKNISKTGNRNNYIRKIKKNKKNNEKKF